MLVRGWAVRFHDRRVQADGDVVIVATKQSTPVGDAEISSSNRLSGGIDLAATTIGALETASTGSR
ncbi:hypothetical protein [Halodesulfurarchaeum sp.]|uniref:hypothetical protein n=1 Tax=Halodesulfurarchaeum sp. TaxID=1980530 RepID=UPI002FC27B83